MRFAAFLTIFALAPLSLFAAYPVHAADLLNAKSGMITDLNRIKPLQNPKYQTAEDVLGRHVLDRKNKVVGTVEDIILNQNGSISSLDVKFDRLNLGRPVFVNYTQLDVKTVTNGYAMSYDSGEIASIYPSLLANIETAGGQEDTFSLSKLKGLEVWTDSGQRIGVVNDVLFGNNGERAEAVYVGLTAGALRGHAVAIPYREANIASVVSSNHVTIADDLAVAMTDFAKQ